MTSNSREELFRIINQVSFAMDDCILFLDTHPYDKEAQQYYHAYHELRKQAIDEYRDAFGPISSYDVAPANEWTWINEPWPWEGEL